MDALRSEGISTLRILDAGCGPGTWLRRIAVRAHRQGLRVEAVGFDISIGQLDIARRRTESLLTRIIGPNRPKIEFV
jgi:ubiquinone/menaquinone biosynthesis C-methylase UbiE